MTLMRTVDDSCSLTRSGELIVRYVPGCSITHRLRIDAAWRCAMITALEFAAQFAYSDRDCERRINDHLDLLDDKMSGLERRIILAYALGKAES